MAIDVKAWYERYGPMVIRRCRTLLRNEDEAMDAVQDVFVNLLKAEYRIEQRIQGIFPSSLLYTMATNICLNRMRRKKLETGKFRLSTETWVSKETGVSKETEIKMGNSVSTDSFSAVPELFYTFDEGFDQVDAEMLVEDILEDESEETQAILFMYHADGMTLNEIGKTVEMSISGVRKRLETFKKRARIKLGDM